MRERGLKRERYQQPTNGSSGVTAPATRRGSCLARRGRPNVSRRPCGRRQRDEWEFGGGKGRGARKNGTQSICLKGNRSVSRIGFNESNNAKHDVVFKALWHWLRWKTVCAWCGRRLRGNPRARKISHSICPSCAEKFWPSSDH